MRTWSISKKLTNPSCIQGMAIYRNTNREDYKISVKYIGRPKHLQWLDADGVEVKYKLRMITQQQILEGLADMQQSAFIPAHDIHLAPDVGEHRSTDGVTAGDIAIDVTQRREVRGQATERLHPAGWCTGRVLVDQGVGGDVCLRAARQQRSVDGVQAVVPDPFVPREAERNLLQFFLIKRSGYYKKISLL